MSASTLLYFVAAIVLLIAAAWTLRWLYGALVQRGQLWIGRRRAALKNIRAGRWQNRHDTSELERRLGVDAGTLASIYRTYRTAHIPKKRGGTRLLHVPNPALKKTQRMIHRRLLRRLRTHPCATGFDPGISIAHNAGMHVGRKVVIKMDIVDFFPGTGAERVEAYFRRIGWAPEAAKLLTGLTTHDGGLPQGAPTSPRLSNLVNHVLDAQIDRWVRHRKGTYTRYADDITISFPKDYPKRIRGTIQQVRRIARRHGYRIHTRGKLRVVRRHQQQRVTGLVVNDRVNLPRARRRLLRAAEHRLRTTGRATLTAEQLAGWRSLEHMIEAQTRGGPDTAAAP